MRNLPILLFDDSCGVCHWLVRFVIRHDPGGRFRFASLTGKTAATLLGSHPGNSLPDSVVLVDDGVHRLRSDAVIRVLQLLGGAWRVPAAAIALVPKRWRDRGYDLIAARRASLTRRFQLACPVPTLAERARFPEPGDLARKEHVT